MISIIICSRTPEISNEFYQNIDKTIGCDYELLVIDNSRNTYSIFEAYNLGTEKSVGSFLCFIHDDILFHTSNWGCIVKSIFHSDKNIGLIGVAGAKVKTKMPSAWWDCKKKEQVFTIIQHHNNKERELQNWGFDTGDTVEVAVIDGVFMAMRKDSRVTFNTKLKGFHAYDLNLSFEMLKFGYSIIVTNKIILEHFSSGVINESWIKDSYNIHRLYKHLLPLSVSGTSISKNDELNNANGFVIKCLQFNLKKIAMLTWFQLFLHHPLSKSHFRFWKTIIKTF